MFHHRLLCVATLYITISSFIPNAKSDDISVILRKLDDLEDQVQTLRELIAREFREIINTQDLIKCERELNYKFIRGKCYYFDSKTQRSFSDAKNFCQTVFGPEKSGKLWEPQNRNINDLVYEESVFILGRRYPFWLGATYEGFKTGYRYSSSGKLISWANWNDGNGTENFSRRTGDECTMITDKVWYDHYCNDSRYTICEAV